jgi:hypothetical protein
MDKKKMLDWSKIPSSINIIIKIIAGKKPCFY